MQQSRPPPTRMGKAGKQGKPAQGKKGKKGKPAQGKKGKKGKQGQWAFPNASRLRKMTPEKAMKSVMKKAHACLRF